MPGPSAAALCGAGPETGFLELVGVQGGFAPLAAWLVVVEGVGAEGDGLAAQGPGGVLAVLDGLRSRRVGLGAAWFAEQAGVGPPAHGFAVATLRGAEAHEVAALQAGDERDQVRLSVEPMPRTCRTPRRGCRRAR